MSDKLTQDFDLYYKELENFTGHFKTSSQQIETDPHLSRTGKSASLAELQKGHEKDLGELGGRLQADFGKRVLDINDFVAGKKSPPFWILLKDDFQKVRAFLGTKQTGSYSMK